MAARAQRPGCAARPEEPPMYVPEAFDLRRLEHRHEVIRTHDFATLVCPLDGTLVASHLPFELDEQAGPLGTLRAHVARTNTHWRAFDGETEALVVFAGPHAYVSPAWYPPGAHVPTWNYVTVHAYGRPVVIDDDDDVRVHLEWLVDRHEGEDGWSLHSQSASFLEGLQRGIVAFEIEIERMEAKAKLGQNHPAAKRRGAMQGLERAGGDANVDVAGWMRRELEGELD